MKPGYRAVMDAYMAAAERYVSTGSMGSFLLSSALLELSFLYRGPVVVAVA